MPAAPPQSIAAFARLSAGALGTRQGRADGFFRLVSLQGARHAYALATKSVRKVVH